MPKAPQPPTSTRLKLRGERGNAAVEFAIVAPLLVLLLVAVVEIGFAVRQKMEVHDAATAGARYAAEHGWDATAIAAAVVASKPSSGVTASPAPTLSCGCPSSTGIATAACTDTCSDGALARSYVQVSASVTRTTFLPSALPLPTTLTANVTTRIP